VAGCDCAEPGGLAGQLNNSPVSLPTGIPSQACSLMTSPVGDLRHKSAGSTALHALDAHLCVHSLSRSEFYLNICAVETELLGPDAPLRAHTDGGSMATTTNRQDYLWDYRDLNPEEQRPVLRVADSRAHHPVGVGFLRVPTRGTRQKYRMAKCFYTPSLPATILSPSAMAHEHKCDAGYTTTLTFDGRNCCVHLL
jgi:hypothetical protein